LGLRDIKIEESYDSEYDNILKEFYIPALSNSISYKRLCGEFSSSTLAIAARGIISLIKNGGIIQLICGSKFNKSDIEAIRNATITPEKILEVKVLEELDNLEEEFIKDHIKAFGWMLSNNLLEIKIAIPRDFSGLYTDEETIMNYAIFHQKVGILEDKLGNKISFSGSQNESLMGWKYNIEEFKVFRSWVENDKIKFNADVQKFENYWNGISKRTNIVSLPEAVRDKLIESKPENINKLKLEQWYIEEIKKKTIILRPYQKEAISAWKKNDYIGIFEMATGTGKTYTALGCLNEIDLFNETLLTIISSPFNHLVSQWKSEIVKYGIEEPIFIADSTNRNWKNKLADLLLDLKIQNIKRLNILTTHDTFSSKDFRDLISSNDSPKLLIVDEVHGIGAPIRSEGLIDNYLYRLGLSATPKRWLDIEGTKKIFDYFDKTVYQFPLSKSIGKYLTEYKYYPHFISLTKEELENFVEKTKKIAKAYLSKSNEDDKNKLFSLLCIERQRIVKDAVGKFAILEEIISKYKNLKHCLVYCSSAQIKKVQNILNKNKIIQHKFTQVEDTKSETKYKGKSERDYLLNKFTDNTINALVAIKCLDEGVDLPQAKIGILMSNSGNPREFIQRRGRLLRKYPGKKKCHYS